MWVIIKLIMCQLLLHCYSLFVFLDGEDFEQVMSVLEFSNSQDSISQVVTLLQDNIVETDEDFSCFIGLVNGEDGASVLIFQHRVTVVIVDRDGKFTI